MELGTDDVLAPLLSSGSPVDTTSLQSPSLTAHAAVQTEDGRGGGAPWMVERAPLIAAPTRNILPLAVLLKRIAKTFHSRAQHRSKPGTFVIMHVPGDTPHGLDNNTSDGDDGGRFATADEDIFYFKVPPTVGSEFALESVLDAEHVDDVEVPSHLPFDWFHLHHRERIPLKSRDDGAPLPVSVFNLLNGTVGVSTLALPLGFARLGFVLSVAALAFMTWINLHASSMMVRVGVAEGTYSYDKTVSRVLGVRGLHVHQAMMILGKIGSLLTYDIFIADFSQQILHMVIGRDIDRRVCVAVAILLVVLPLSLLRRVSSLRFTGSMCVVFVMFCSFALLLRACQAGIAPTAKAVDTTFENFFNGLCIIGFMLSSQATVFPVCAHASGLAPSSPPAALAIFSTFFRAPSPPPCVSATHGPRCLRR